MEQSGLRSVAAYGTKCTLNHCCVWNKADLVALLCMEQSGLRSLLCMEQSGLSSVAVYGTKHT